MVEQKVCDHSITENTGAHQSCVAIVPIFNHLEHEEVQEVAKAARPIGLKRGELLYNAGDESDSLYIVHKGKLKVYRLSESGKEQVIRILEAGEFTGELALFTQKIHDSYAEAVEKTEICSIQRTRLNELLLKYPNISLKILNEFSTRLDQTEHQVTSFATEGAETRIALYLAQESEKNRSAEIRLPMTKKDLASYLGTTPETVSRKLAKFEDEGWIEQLDQRGIRIKDMDALLLV
ncbi:Crp/Fnr family transcriptional regulator [Planococcus salinus]|uniref:Crp/Fnr family transcriptional regulator n=1 Tax=Planococcus salinus TaxID=1848460 RepID=A0A3M8PBQ9_9BACL|nr:Crp/Fnr family transcriptional regulator [Planococcus salinus]RNF41156.1 Crp/Fnr family transcriptional regulator [Planococcus salinus]